MTWVCGLAQHDDANHVMEPIIPDDDEPAEALS